MKFTHNKIKKTGIAALAAATALTAVPAFGTFADEAGGNAKKGTVTVEYVYGTTESNRVSIPGARFEIYKVGDIDIDTGEITFSSEYDDANINLEASDDEIATTLGNYAVAKEDILPTQESETNEDGKITFVALEQGAYVLVGFKTEYNGYEYGCEPSYFTIPSNKKIISRETANEEEEGDELHHDITVYPKLERTKPGEEDSLIDLEAIKIWKDENNAYSLRPESITVELWQRNKTDGTKKSCGTQVLNEANNWRYVWKDLDSSNFEYYCVEKDVPGDYVVSESSGQDSQTKRYFYSFTNTYKKEETTTETTNPPGTYTKRNTNKTLPYTGMLWWPVPFLAAGGLALVLGGGAGKRRRAAADRDSED